MPLPSVPTVPSLQALLEGTPLAGRSLGLVAGVLLLGWGGRLYRLVVLLPGLLGGVWLAASVRPLLGMTNGGAVILGAVLAGLGALACHLVEGVAVRLVGAAIGVGVTVWVWPLFGQAGLPWYAPLVGGGLLALVFPRVWKLATVPLTALFGAQLVAWGVGHPTSAPLILGLTAVGTVAQVWLGRRGGGKEE